MNFDTIINCHDHISNKLLQIKEKDENLNNIYLNYIQSNNDKSLSLDSFLFQNTLFDFEYEFLNKYYNLINNRLYCHYYKLYKQILKYINENFKDEITFKENNYPPYKDLEKFKVYNFNVIIDIHHDTINLIHCLEKFNENKSGFIKSVNENLSKGFKIDLFLYDFINEKKQLEQNIELFKTYLNTFYNYHEQYFKTLEYKINKFFNEYSILFNLKNKNNDYDHFFNVFDESQEHIDKEIIHKKQLKYQVLENKEQERLEKERIEKERIEKERLEQLEKERIEKERLEKERLEKERLEQLEKEKQNQNKNNNNNKNNNKNNKNKK